MRSSTEKARKIGYSYNNYLDILLRLKSGKVIEKVVGPGLHTTKRIAGIIIAVLPNVTMREARSTQQLKRGIEDILEEYRR